MFISSRRISSLTALIKSDLTLNQTVLLLPANQLSRIMPKSVVVLPTPVPSPIEIPARAPVAQQSLRVCLPGVNDSFELNFRDFPALDQIFRKSRAMRRARRFNVRQSGRFDDLS